MKTKICSKCQKEKSLEEFSPNKNNKDSKQSYCRDCDAKYRTNYRKKYPWKSVLDSIKQRCNNLKNSHYKYYGSHGIKCLITIEELKELWFRDKAFEMKRPSIDRIDNNGNYCLKNCRFVEWGENSAERNVRVLSKPINQYDLQGNFIKRWKSMREVERVLGFSTSNISMCCREKYKQAYGFIWKYIKKGSK